MLANFFFYRDPERPFDTERPRNWGSFGAELNGFGEGVVSDGFSGKASKLSFLGSSMGSMLFGRLVGGGKCVRLTPSVRLTPNVRGIGARLEQNSMG